MEHDKDFVYHCFSLFTKNVRFILRFAKDSGNSEFLVIPACKRAKEM